LKIIDGLHIYRERLKSLKGKGDHGGRIEGSIDKAVRLAIYNAIKNRLMLQIYYKGDLSEKPGWRFIQPYCYGLNKFTGNHVLRAYQLSGPSESEHIPYWRMFRADRIGNIATTKQTFDTPVFLWNPTGDLGMSKILAIIKFPKK
jgi:predicted DNA-binding transcriptional regulator YafY